MYVLVGPAGGNINYIAQVLTNTVLTPMLAYHYNTNGSHTKSAMTWKQICPPTDEYKKYLNETNFIIQILSKQKFFFVILNWFEKHSRSPAYDNIYFKTWISTQANLWKSVVNEKYVLVKAVLKWYYNLKEENIIDNIDIPQIKNKFMFDNFYASDFNLIKKEFEQYGVEYKKHMFDEWLSSQKIIFESYKQIKNNIDTPWKLKKFWQTGLALALHAEKYNIGEEEVWEKFYD
jgi:hypothetical protein